MKHLAQVTRAHKGLAHGGGVDVDLQRRLTPGQQVGLEVRRHVDDESEAAAVQRRVQLRVGQQLRSLEFRRLYGFGQAPRERAAILVDEGHAGVMHTDHRAGGRHVDGDAEGVEQKQQQDAVVAQAGQLLEAEAEDMRELAHARPPVSSAATRSGSWRPERTPAAPGHVATARASRGPW